jgi:hypothetical protein
MMCQKDATVFGVIIILAQPKCLDLWNITRSPGMEILVQFRILYLGGEARGFCALFGIRRGIKWGFMGRISFEISRPLTV